MKKALTMMGAALALCVASTSSMAFQHYGEPPHHGESSHHDSHDHHYKGFHDRGRHEGWYKKGGHVPQEYRHGTWVVTDWRSHRLHAPPRGYEYVRSDNGDFLLVAVATGVIASIIAGH
jgi:Ni/Co efflux regulator RcnB